MKAVKILSLSSLCSVPDKPLALDLRLGLIKLHFNEGKLDAG